MGTWPGVTGVLMALKLQKALKSILTIQRKLQKSVAPVKFDGFVFKG